MPPSAERKRAGFVISERLWVGSYGETFRAAGAGRRDLQALVVDPRIAGEPGVASALVDEVVPALRPIHHRAIVGTVAAVRDGGDLVVVTEEIPPSVTLHEALARARLRGRPVPREIAAAIGRAVVDAAATAHAAGVVHGAIHPRSVLIDAEGHVRLADFAVGRAVVATGNPELRRHLTGFVAPELDLDPDALGPAADVYALGSLLFLLLTGELPPGSLNTSPAVERAVQRALDTDLARRFLTAIELQENLAEAVEDDRWVAAALPEIARFISFGRADSLDASTEDLLASLGAAADPPTRDTLDLSELETTSEDPPLPSSTGSLDAVLSDLDDADEHTEVDGARVAVGGGPREPDRDPISEMLAIERARTGAPVVDEPPPPTRKSGERARRVGSTSSGAKPRPRTPSGALGDALASLDAEPDAPRAASPRIATPAFELDPAPVPQLNTKSRLPGLIWLVVLLAAGAALVWVILDLRDKNREVEADKLKKEEEAAAKEKEYEALLKDPGAIRITSVPDKAAVWIRLGRTPVQSFGVPTNNHILRLERKGNKPADAVVMKADWMDADGIKFAPKNVTLEAGEVPEAPPPVPQVADEVWANLGGRPTDPRGYLKIDSTPQGAEVWLLVGTTNNMRLDGVTAGREYELRVLKEDHEPAYVTIRAEDWRAGGDPNEPLDKAPKHAVLEREVTLVPTAPVETP